MTTTGWIGYPGRSIMEAKEVAEDIVKDILLNARLLIFENKIRSFRCFDTKNDSESCSIYPDELERSVEISGRTLKCHGLYSGALPKSMFQTIEILAIERLFLSSVNMLISLDLSNFLLASNLKALSVTDCPQLVSVKFNPLVSDRYFTECCWTLLDFCRNQALEALPLASIARMPEVTELRCMDNMNLWSPPQEVSQQGGAETMRFVRGALRQGRFNRKMTLFLIGDGEAGKTSVLRALKSRENRAEKIQEDHRTVGIDVEDWSLSHGSDEMLLKIFDLAGQAVYSHTHQFFLQRRAVYMLVWRAFPVQHARFSVVADRIRHWMNCIQLRMPGSRLILVVTHIDQVEQNLLDSLCARVKETVVKHLLYLKQSSELDIPTLTIFNDGESIRVNCLMGHGIASLRENLFLYIQSMPWYNESLPYSWVSTMNVLDVEAKAGKRFLSRLEFDRIANENSLTGEMLPIALKFMHETGVVRYFGDFNSFSKKRKKQEGGSDQEREQSIFISPKFIAAVMKGLIRHDRQALQDYFYQLNDLVMLRHTNRLNSCGVLHKDLLPFLWPVSEQSMNFWNEVRTENSREAALWHENLVSTQEDLDCIIELLTGFDLMVRKGVEYIVPCLTPLSKTQINAAAFNEAASPCAVSITYPIIPNGFFHRIIVKIAGSSAYVSYSAISAVFAYRGNSGMIFLSESQSCSENGLCRLKLSSSSRKHLNRLVQEVENVERFFPGLRRIDLVQAAPPDTYKEPVQVLILWPKRGECQLLDVLRGMGKDAMDLDIEEELLCESQKFMHYMKQVRVVLLCLSEGFTDECCSHLENIKSISSVVVIPILMGGYIDKEDLQWKLESITEACRVSWIDLQDYTRTKEEIRASVLKKIMEKEANAARNKKDFKPRTQSERMTECEQKVSEASNYQVNFLPKQLEKELLPRVLQHLDAWSPSATSYGHDFNISCSACPKILHDQQAYRFDRKDCLQQWQSLKDAQIQDNREIVQPLDCVVICPKCAGEQKLSELLAEPEARPCPVCLKYGKSVGYFYARECRLLFHGSFDMRVPLLNCDLCDREKRTEKIHLFSVFSPDVYVSYYVISPEAHQGVTTLLHAVEAEADLLIWTRRSAVSDAALESKFAIETANIFVCILSDLYMTSDECIKEICKY